MGVEIHTSSTLILTTKSTRLGNLNLTIYTRGRGGLENWGRGSLLANPSRLNSHPLFHWYPSCATHFAGRVCTTSYRLDLGAAWSVSLAGSGKRRSALAAQTTECFLLGSSIYSRLRYPTFRCLRSRWHHYQRSSLHEQIKQKTMGCDMGHTSGSIQFGDSERTCHVQLELHALTGT